MTGSPARVWREHSRASGRCRAISRRAVTASRRRSPATSAEHLRDLGDGLGIGENLGHFARALAVAGRPETAAQILSSSEALYEETGGGVLVRVAKMNAETLDTIRSEIGERALAEALEQGRTLTIDDAIALALSTAPASEPSSQAG